MNFKNRARWLIIVILTIGLYNMFKNPQNLNVNKSEKIIFSKFLDEVDNGRVVVQIQGNNIKGVMANGGFTTYSVLSKSCRKIIR